MQFLICYDIQDNRVRSKIAKYLESFARRIQYSVFLCEISDKKVMMVKNKLLGFTLEHQCGSVFVYPICEKCQEKIWQIGTPLEEKAQCYIF